MDQRHIGLAASESDLGAGSQTSSGLLLLVPQTLAVSPAMYPHLYASRAPNTQLARVVGRRLRADADAVSLRLPPAARFVYRVEPAFAGGFTHPETPGGFIGWLSFEQLVELSGGDTSYVCRLAADFVSSEISSTWVVDHFSALKVADRLSVVKGGLSVASERMFLVRWGYTGGGGGSWEFESDLRALDPDAFERAARAFFEQWRPPADAALDVRRSFMGCTAATQPEEGPVTVRPVLAARARPVDHASSASVKPPQSVAALAAAAAMALQRSLPVPQPGGVGGSTVLGSAVSGGGAHGTPSSQPPPHRAVPQRPAYGGAGPALDARTSAQPPQQALGHSSSYASLRESSNPDDVLKWAFDLVRNIKGLSYLQVRQPHERVRPPYLRTPFVMPCRPRSRHAPPPRPSPSG